MAVRGCSAHSAGAAIRGLLADDQDETETSPAAGHSDQAALWPLGVLLVVAIPACIVYQLTYLNRALATFPTKVVAPLYYAGFTTATLAAAALLHRTDTEATSASAAPTPASWVSVACTVLAYGAHVKPRTKREPHERTTHLRTLRHTQPKRPPPLAPRPSGP